MDKIKQPFKWWRSCVRNLNRRQRYLGLVVHFVVTTSLTFLLLIISNLLFLSSTIVQGESMEPTLLKDDRLLIFKSQSILHRILADDYVPERGDIVIIRSPQNRSRLLVKRVIGLPNERVVIGAQAIVIYNQQVPTGFIPQLDFIPKTTFKIDEEHDVKLGYGQIFVLGDNRQASTDSRNFGALSTTDIVGRLFIRFWPFNSITVF